MQRSWKITSEIKIFKKQAIEIDPENDSNFAVQDPILRMVVINLFKDLKENMDNERIDGKS